MTGVAVHFDSPSARPPQAVLLMTVPAPDPGFNVNEIVGILRDTLVMARCRAIGTETLDSLGHYLPGVFLPEGYKVGGPGVSWQRIEAATVDPDLDQGLEARIADPYWLLARQWQSGEFGGEDAANPLFMSIRGRWVPLDSVRIGGRPTDPQTDLDAPLEPVVEREPVRGGPSGARVAAELGQLLLRALAAAQIPVKWRTDLRAAHPVRLPPTTVSTPRAGAGSSCSRGSASTASPSARRSPRTPCCRPCRRWPPRRRVRNKLDNVGRAWLPIALGAFSEPGGQRAWAPSRMEYRFTVGATTASGPVELSADGYGGGRLEWYHFDWKSGAGFAVDEPDASDHSAELLPAPLRFRGMPASRFWEFENRDVYFGGVDAAPEDLARLAVAGYATLYGDDWYVIPIRLRRGHARPGRGADRRRRLRARDAGLRRRRARRRAPRVPLLRDHRRPRAGARRGAAAARPAHGRDHRGGAPARGRALPARRGGQPRVGRRAAGGERDRPPGRPRRARRRAGAGRGPTDDRWQLRAVDRRARELGAARAGADRRPDRRGLLPARAGRYRRGHARRTRARARA